MRTTVPTAVLLAALSAAACKEAPAPPPSAAPRPAHEIACPAGPGSLEPAFDAVSGAPPLLSWLDTAAGGRPALRFATWDGTGFAAVRTVVEDDALARDPADAPGVHRLADSSLLAHWTVKNPADAYAHDLVAAVSRDGGATWSTPVRPHRDGVVAEHGFASVVPDASGPGASLVWLDGRGATEAAGAGAATALYLARWDGSSFGPERLLDPRVCDCCRTAALASAGGALVAYRDRSESEVRDVSLVTVGAQGPQPARDLHRDGWTVNACPTNGPALAAGPDGTLLAAWFTAAGGTPALWAAVSRDAGATFGSPARLDAGAPIGRADAAATPDGVATVWLEKTGAGAEVRARLVRKDGSAGDPVTVASVTGAKGAGVPRAAFAGGLLVAWTEPGPPPRVRVAAVDLPR